MLTFCLCWLGLGALLMLTVWIYDAYRHPGANVRDCSEMGWHWAILGILVMIFAWPMLLRYLYVDTHHHG